MTDLTNRTICVVIQTSKLLKSVSGIDLGDAALLGEARWGDQMQRNNTPRGQASPTLPKVLLPLDLLTFVYYPFSRRNCGVRRQNVDRGFLAIHPITSRETLARANLL